MLLVDSELLVAEDCQQGKVDKWRPWRHLGERQGDHWAKPAEAAERDCHLMVQCMEAWFLADRKTLQDFFGHGFHVQSLPAPEKNIESIPRQVQALQGWLDCFYQLHPSGPGSHAKELQFMSVVLN